MQKMLNPENLLDFLKPENDNKIEKLQKFLTSQTKTEFFTPVDIPNDPKYNIVKCHSKHRENLEYLNR